MSRYDRFIEAPYQGVSQAPQATRLEQQAEMLQDCMIAVPQGFTDRPPMDFVRAVPGAFSNSSKSMQIEDGDNRYGFILHRGTGASDCVAYLTDLLGNTDPDVTISAEAQAYLDAGNPNPSLDYRLLHIEDYTFILNRKVPVDIQRDGGGLPEKHTERPNEGIVWVRQAAFGRTYTVTVTPEEGTPITASLRTPNGKDSEDAQWVDTDVLADALRDGSYTTVNAAFITGNLNALTSQGFTVALQGSVLYLSHPSTAFTIEVKDGQGGSAMLAIKDKAQTVSDLPKVAVDGFTVRISQTTGAEEDDYYLRYAESAGPGTGIWEETVGSGAEKGIDPATLPVALEYNPVGGTWEINVQPWGERDIGDEDLAPDPGFVGLTLEDISFWAGRIALVYNEGGRLSSASDPFRLYPKTLSQVLADDPVELINPHDRKAKFHHATSFKRKLILVGEDAQAQVTIDAATNDSETLRIDEFAAYESSDLIDPQPINDRLYMMAPRGQSSSTVYEFEITGSIQTEEGDDMGVSVPKYVEADVDLVTSCPVNYMACYGKTGSQFIYCHLFRYTERQRIQNAWFRWKLQEGWTLRGMWFDNTTLFVYASSATMGAVILSLRTAPGVLDVDDASRVLTKFDFRVVSEDCSPALQPSGDTLFTLPYSVPTGSVFASVRAPGGEGGLSITGSLLPASEGIMPEVVSYPAANQVLLEGDWTNCPLYLGLKYSSIWELSTIYARNQEDDSPIRSGRMVLKKITWELQEATRVNVTVKVGGRAAREYLFEGPRFDDPDTDFDEVGIFTGEWATPIRGSSDDVSITVSNPSHLSTSVMGFTWHGELNAKSRRG